MNKYRFTATLAVLATAFLGMATASSAAPSPASNGDIAFSRGQTVGWGESVSPHRINVVDQMGVKAKQISDGGGNATAEDLHPAYSWSGEKIAFSRSSGVKTADIYVMNASGTGITKVTSGSGYKTDPDFTPDDKRIVFSSYNDGSREIYSIGVDGKGLKQLTNNEVEDGSPSVDPEGRIFFSSSKTKNGFTDIFRMNSSGGQVVQLTDDPKIAELPSASRTGNIVTFSSYRDGNWEIYSMNPDGSNQKRLTNNPAADRCSEVSPDGKKIAFCTNRYSSDVWGYDIATMNSSGGGLFRVTKKATTDVEPSWQPIILAEAPVFQFNTPQAPPLVLSTFPASPGTSLTPQIRGLAEPGTKVMLFTTNDCSGNPVATDTAGVFNGEGIKVQVAPKSTTTFKAIAISPSNVYSPCSPTSVTYKHEDLAQK